MDSVKIGFVGGDRRMLECASELAKHGYEAAVCGFDGYKDSDGFGDAIRTDISGALTRSDAVVLPLPCCSHGLCLNAPYSTVKISCETLLRSVPQDCTIFCGKPPEELVTVAKQNGKTLIDYFTSEKLQILNAVSTVEGALATAITESDIALHSSAVLITGYGRIAKLLSKSLLSLGAKVTVAARSSEALTWAQVLGCKAVHIGSIASIFCEFDFIFNTVPAPVIGEKELASAKCGVVAVELASAPGGIDRKAAEEHGVKLIHALGLPGKNSPKSAGIYISKVLLDYLGGTFSF